LLATWLPFLAIMSSTSPLALAQTWHFDMTRRGRSGRSMKIAQAMRCATLTRDNVAALPRASSLGCTPKCLGATINSDRSLGADPSTRCRSASVTGLAPSPQRPWGCEKSSNAVRNLRARGLWCASAFRKRWQTYIKQKSLEKNKGDRSLPHRACDLRD
jgi:hypothetical protein